MYDWPPCTNKPISVPLWVENIIKLFFTKQPIFMRRSIVLSLPRQLVFLAFSDSRDLHYKPFYGRN